MGEWKEITLGALVTLQRGHDLPESNRVVGNVPVLGSFGITGWHNEAKAKGIGVTVGRSGASFGIVSYSSVDYWPLNTALYVKDFHGNDPKFAYYFLKTMDFQGYNSGSAQPSLNRNHIHPIKISVPDVTEQKAIASVLSSLDDKIDLLHRQNKTLEALAEALFRQCFGEQAQEDWEERPLSGIANFLNGLACQKYPPENDLEKLPVLKIKELGSGISESSDWATSKVRPEYIVETGDVIFSWSASLMVKVWDGDRCVLNQHLFKVTSDEFPRWFYLLWCKHHLAEFISISSSHATTMGHIKRGDLDTAMVSIPSPQDRDAMSVKMVPLLDKQIENAKQIKTLEKLRDTLLPKLMSGEVRINQGGR